jgi:hypothetical protein
VTTMQLTLPPSRYPSNAARRFYHSSSTARAASPDRECRPRLVPAFNGTDSSPSDLPGRPPRSSEPARHANTEAIEGDYFRAMAFRRCADAARARRCAGLGRRADDHRRVPREVMPATRIHRERISTTTEASPRVVGSVTQEYFGQPPHPTTVTTTRTTRGIRPRQRLAQQPA